jgi:hypothetical protein
MPKNNEAGMKASNLLYWRKRENLVCQNFVSLDVSDFMPHSGLFLFGTLQAVEHDLRYHFVGERSIGNDMIFKEPAGAPGTRMGGSPLT